MSFNKKSGLYEGYIYCIKNTINNKKYIGQTIKTLSERFGEHKWDAVHRNNHRGMILYRAMNKYGIDKFCIIEIEKISDADKKVLRKRLDELEILYISKYHTLSPDGYNVSPGGYVVPPDRKTEVFQFDMSGNLIGRYNSLMDAERITGISHTSISQSMSNNIPDKKSAGGSLWSKTDQPPEYHLRRRNRTVAQLSLDGCILNVFISATDAAKKLNLQNTLISACCHGRRKSTGGFRWSFI